MTEKDIIKALECIASKENVLCKNCPYNKYHLMECHRTASKDALDLINRQQAEIERLQNENNQFADIGKLYSEIKAEAIKEFAELIKANKHKLFFSVKGFDEQIDNLKKEMVGDNNAE